MRSWLCSIACLLLVPAAVADDAPAHHVYAKPVVQTAPKYPAMERSRGHQGWVELNFVVTEDGEVVDPVVEASSGSRAFEHEAIKTVKRWRYEPATKNGKPVPQSKTAVRISFAMDGAQDRVSRVFYSVYRKVDKAIDEGNIDLASTELARLFASQGLTLGELSWLWTLQARIAGVRGDTDLQLLAVQRALAVSEEWIPSSLRMNLLTTRVYLETRKGNYAEAMDAYMALKAMDGADTSELDSVAKEIEALVESDQLLLISAEIGSARCVTCESSWRYKPLRRAIEITDIDGELGTLEFRCDWQRFVGTARDGVAWQIPASWGDCSVVVHGKTGSTFTLVELPSS